jgi:hypothetical protein
VVEGLDPRTATFGDCEKALAMMHHNLLHAKVQSEGSRISVILFNPRLGVAHRATPTDLVHIGMLAASGYKDTLGIYDNKAVFDDIGHLVSAINGRAEKLEQDNPENYAGLKVKLATIKSSEIIPG